jgi:hypothetical protein
MISATERGMTYSSARMQVGRAGRPLTRRAVFSLIRTIVSLALSGFKDAGGQD